MTQQTNPAPLLAVENLKKSYLIRGGRFGRPTARKQALAGVSFTLGPGLYGLLGPNGAGKSTLINIITGSLKQDSGTVQWCGKNARALDIRFRRALGYMPQQQGLYDSYTGRRFLAYMCALKEIPSKDVPTQVEQVAEWVNLSHELDKRLAAYSGGMKQRLLLASALLGDPKLLILDEPTAGLDPVGVDSILSNIRDYHQARNATIIIVSHSMEEMARTVDRLVVVDHGKLPFTGTPREVFAHGDELERIGLGVPAMTRVFHRLRAMGVEIDPSVYTIEQARDAILAKLGRGSASDERGGE